MESLMEHLEAEDPPDPARGRHRSASADQAEKPAALPSTVQDREEFRRKYFPKATRKQWDSWSWQLANRVTTLDRLERIIFLQPDERLALGRFGSVLPFAVTPYYLSLINGRDSQDALRRCVIPSIMEQAAIPGESADPLHEEGDSPVPGIIHRYPNRVLFLATNFCSAYCRYCTRSRVVGDGHSQSTHHWDAALDYIRRTPAVRDVLISGGDPLTMSDAMLDNLLARVRAVKHVEFVRIGSKIPAVLPQRVTASLVRVLKKYHPLWISLHFTHPGELTPETSKACNRLADAGIPLGSQTVLLSGVNDDAQVLKKLYHGLLKIRVRPYYLYQCDPIQGSGHFRTTVAKGLEIMSLLRGHTTGYAVPTYVIDAPGGGGKIPVYPQTIIDHGEQGLKLINWEGKTCLYPDNAKQEAEPCSWA